MKNEQFERKNYIRKLNLQQARTKFKYRCSMTQHVKMNQKNNQQYAEALWRCEECGLQDTNSHLVYCEGYRILRDGQKSWQWQRFVWISPENIPAEEWIGKFKWTPGLIPACACACQLPQGWWLSPDKQKDQKETSYTRSIEILILHALDNSFSLNLFLSLFEVLEIYIYLYHK